MSRFRVIVVAVLAATLVTSGAFAGPARQGRPQAGAKLDVRAAAEKVAREQAERPHPALQAQRQTQNGGGSGNGSGAAPVADREEVDEAYEAEIQGLTGRRMNVSYTNAAPEIDGILNDPEWNFAEVVGDFRQREPDNGQPGSERTEVRMLYDDDALYFAFYMYDREPDKILAQDLRRDSRMSTDDTIAVVLDTFHDHRNSYAFRVNPLGTKYDVEVRNETQINADWDERWDAAVTITDEGWFAEFRIPFSSLRYRTGSHVWGIDFKREIRRRNEEADWNNYRRGFQMSAASQFGHLVGLRDLGLTQRFRFQPYVSGAGSQFNTADEPFNEAAGDIGIEDFKVQITPNLTADLTVNTDFAQVEDDTERVNLTRFPLFFPEKREFFLESASNFAFGGGGGGRGGGFGRAPSVSLYHSRNIGLVGGEPVPMRYGVKLTGKIGSTNIGFVNAQTGNSEINLVDDLELFNPGKNFTVLRLRQDVFNRSSVGMIFTNVQGDGEYNRVAGVDASFRFYDFLSISGEIAGVLADDVLEAIDELDDNPITARFGAGWNSDLWNVSGSYQRIDDDFKTDLGFIRRGDVATQSYRLGWSPRPAFAPAIRQFRFSGNFNYLTDVDGNFLEQSASLTATTTFQSGDRVTFNIRQESERLDQVFFVSSDDNIFVLPGDYDTRGYWVNFDSFNARKLSGRMTVSWGDYWDGTQYAFRPGGTVRFNEKFSLSPSYSYNHIDLPTGIFVTHTITTRVAYNFNERWLTNSLVQYNSVSGRASVFFRLRYVISEIDSFFLVYKSTRIWDEVWNGVADHQLIAKMTYSIDF